MEQTITPPGSDDVTALAKQLVRAEQLTLAHAGKPLTGELTDLDIVQSVLDTGALAATDTYDLQCLGTVFGTLLVDAIAHVDWAMVEDEYGRDPALRYPTRASWCSR